MKFCWTTINVKNMEESLQFYQEIVGLNIDRRIKVEPDIEIAFLGSGETKVELIYNGKSNIIGTDVSLGFEVDCAEEKMEFLKNIGYEIGGPHTPPGRKFFFIKDPNGLKIQFVENIK